MKKLLLYFGFISVVDLLREVKEYDDIQSKQRVKLHVESIEILNEGKTNEAREKFIDGLLVGYQGMGAREFVANFVRKWIIK